ncbi:hypothetical protein U732_34 [Clostridium argentinense CDC 2741]|uniref:Uncharacterized protein n=2 Tax=Clostridium argentinense TaxID=29341 RepID=A0A0C1R2R5_9CLOT|nr:hypothetical protein [Clostridium argentinense]ARC83110.1 hypothetical protein RSJ17_00210 [Clostridium argentinense]KIE44731.1 hypothetical protein U732_34 [Clostridium argentinense CDC 2741]NFF41337.1 hypothetical protein [Clostridium argentinense]NFP51768.1 hypothetical protein [Clostridium argentinense]NFP74262.1 hypothetical protein [Clostridium argentinense]
MRKKAKIINKNLKGFNFNELVFIIQKNSKILGKTVKELYDMETDEVAIIKEKDSTNKDIDIYLIKREDIQLIK